MKPLRLRFVSVLALALLSIGLAALAHAADAADAAVAASTQASAPQAAASAPSPSLDSRVQELKAEVLRLNRDLLVLEEDLLFPPGTQVAVFVSLDMGLLFDLESVRVLLDDQVVASQLYTPLQVQALRRGGMQRLFLGNLRTGKHSLTAYFTGRGPAHGDDRRDYKRAAQLDFDKGSNPQFIELRISDKAAKLQPEFEVKVWP